ncbi:MAG: hypothetical protein KIT33_15655 [Candidatus Kapabacteria bacterium]|nr:hypothetical protein [Ignavibacteriota bacterium]MCW5886406.1 hypothetical protein [Candidatus Kapabacteria bacterium]
MQPDYKVDILEYYRFKDYNPQWRITRCDNKSHTYFAFPMYKGTFRILNPAIQSLFVFCAN